MNRTTRYLALAGVVTGAAGVGTSQAAVWFLRVDNAPVYAVAAMVRDATPGSVAHWLIDRVGSWDKPLLVTGTALLLLAVCAWVGTLSVRLPLLTDLVYVVLAGLGLYAVHRLDDSSAGSYFAVLVGLITWIVVNRFLTAPLVAGKRAAAAESGDPEAEVAEPATVPRRDVLQRAGGIALFVGALAYLGRLTGADARKVEQARRLLRLPGTNGRVPAGANLRAGIGPWRTPNDDFYRIDTALLPPSIAPADWSLRIHGMVEKEMTLSYRDLVHRQMTEDWITICCVSNEVGGDLIGNAWWSGVLIRDLLAEAKPLAGADAVRQTSEDGWNCGTPLAALTDPERNAMLALQMNGEPLPIEHGFPVRMVVPGLYGYVSATKWLVDLEVTRFADFEAYWTERGWSEKGPVKTQSRIDVPRDGSDVEAGTVVVGGSAWAQHTGIAKVEYQLDGGPWREAELGTVPNADTWVQWKGEVQAGEGSHTLVVRATDASGYTQTSVRTDVAPDGATGWHTIDFDAE